MRDPTPIPLRASPPSLRSRLALIVFTALVALLCVFCVTAPAAAQADLHGPSRDYRRISEWSDAELRMEFRDLRRAIDSTSRAIRRLEARQDSLVRVFIELTRAPAAPPGPVLPETSVRPENRFREAARRAAARTDSMLFGRPISAAPTYRELHDIFATGDAWKARSLAAAAVPLAYAAGRLQHDPGGYVDSWRFIHDKQAHFASSVVLGAVTGAAVGDAWGLTACVAAGAALELGQSSGGGYFSGRDLAYDAAGCAGGLVVRRAIVALHAARVRS